MRLALLCRVALVVFCVVALQETRALGGTTGVLAGYVLTPSGVGIASVKVSVTSPAVMETTTSDSAGHFVFISLPPDSYNVTASKEGYDPQSRSGVLVTADQTHAINITLHPTVKTLGTVTTRAAAALVRPGEVQDVYKVDATTQQKVASLGGSGSLTQAYSAMAATPGVTVAPGQSGWFQTVHIRGGDYDQVGYEFDGIPVLRAYDNYPTTDASTLGQQELQVYTGAAPVNSESQGLSGYVNQVIKSGTYPGFGNISLSTGAPQYHYGASLDVGGATPDRLFSYYIGMLSSYSRPRIIDQFNGASYQQLWGTPFALLPCPNAGATHPNADFTSCYASGTGPAGYLLSGIENNFNVSDVWDYENVVNLHFGIPHHNDSGKDDIQALYDNSYLHNLYYGSGSDFGMTDPYYANVYWGTLGSGLPGIPQSQFYLSGPGFGAQYLGAVGAPLDTKNYATLTHPVYFAYNPQSQNLNSCGTISTLVPGTFACIPLSLRDGTANPNSIIKLQYQRNFSPSSYLRIYGFTNYSSWPQSCPVTGTTNYIGYCPLNYYVQSYTSGFSATYANQINDTNLLTLLFNNWWAEEYRSNDTTMVNGEGRYAYAVNANNPQEGKCYSSGASGAPALGTPVSCFSPFALAFTLANSLAGAPLPALPANCGGGPCEWWVAENGRRGGANQEWPQQGTAAIMDQIKLGRLWQVNLGFRQDRYFYKLSDTTNGARPFWFNAWNNTYCVIPGGGQVPFFNPADATAFNQPCGKTNINGVTGVQTVPATLTNVPNATTEYWVFEPRLGFTYSAGQDDVFRGSAGRFAQPGTAAFQQYNLLQQNIASYDGKNFWPVGFTSTVHVIPPATSWNYDLSWEHQFKGTDASLKLTPYLRRTTGQIQNFFLDQKTGFVSGLNVGNQTNEGFEFLTQIGNFNRNGWSGLVSWTYTYDYVTFSSLSNGQSVLSTINKAIQQYNAFTSACKNAVPTTDPTALCGSYGNALLAGGDGPAGNPGATFNGGISNPYYNAPAQPLLSLGGKYPPYSTIPGTVESEVGSYVYPNVGTLVINYRHNQFAISPQVQYFQGVVYGEPLSGYGLNPARCSTALPGSVSGDPRYPYGGTGAPVDATSCAGRIAIPDPYTGAFDAMGAFRNPNQLLLHMQISYDVTNRATAVIYLSNIMNTCFGGSTEPWTRFNTPKTCNFVLPGYGAPVPFGANIYNPPLAVQPEFNYPYQMNPSSVTPFQATFQMNFKL